MEGSFFENKSGRFNKFGTYIKAARMGYHSTPNETVLMRMSWRDGNTVFIELLPFMPEFHQYLQRSHLEHIIWWAKGDDFNGGIDIIKASPALKPLLFVKKLKRPVSFYIDGDSGILIK